MVKKRNLAGRRRDVALKFANYCKWETSPAWMIPRIYSKIPLPNLWTAPTNGGDNDLIRVISIHNLRCILQIVWRVDWQGHTFVVILKTSQRRSRWLVHSYYFTPLCWGYTEFGTLTRRRGQIYRYDANPKLCWNSNGLIFPSEILILSLLYQTRYSLRIPQSCIRLIPAQLRG